MLTETIKLTTKFKLKETPKGLDDLFSVYREIVNFLISYAHENNITSFYRLKKETYKELRGDTHNYQAITFTRLAKWLPQFTRATGRESGREKLRESQSSRRTL